MANLNDLITAIRELPETVSRRDAVRVLTDLADRTIANAVLAEFPDGAAIPPEAPAEAPPEAPAAAVVV